jgi:hypothetical protein
LILHSAAFSEGLREGDRKKKKRKENVLTKQKQYFQNSLCCFQTISINPLIHFDLFPSISRLTLLYAFIVLQE